MTDIRYTSHQELVEWKSIAEGHQPVDRKVYMVTGRNEQGSKFLTLARVDEEHRPPFIKDGLYWFDYDGGDLAYRGLQPTHFAEPIRLP